MNSDPTLIDRLIEDIWALWRLLSKPDATDADGAAVVTYLLANQRIIEDLLHIVYERHTIEDRQRLHADDVALDRNAANYTFYSIASRPLGSLSRGATKASADISPEDLTALIRGLEYARGFDTHTVNGPLKHSPAATQLVSRQAN